MVYAAGRDRPVRPRYFGRGYVVSHFLEPAAARIRFFTQSGVPEAVPSGKGYELFFPAEPLKKSICLPPGGGRWALRQWKFYQAVI